MVCLECIPDKAQQERVKNSLTRSFDTIEISMEQMEQHFCGNILQVNSAGGNPLIVMSRRAFEGFLPEQIKTPGTVWEDFAHEPGQPLNRSAGAAPAV